MVFENRQEAGKKLATELFKYRQENPYVLALPRGGVPIGYEIAEVLDAPLSVLIVRKIILSGDSEFGIGAVAEGGVRVLDQTAIEVIAIDENEVKDTVQLEEEELKIKVKNYRGNTPLPNLKGKTAILVDDGMASFATAKAAVEAVKKLNPKKIIFATPVCTRGIIESLRRLTNKVVYLFSPFEFMADGLWYRNFTPITDEEVVDLLKKAQQTLKKEIQIPVNSVTLEGMLEIPQRAKGIVLFAHGSGSGRFSPRNNFVAKILRDAGIGTLLIDLLTKEEDGIYQTRFDIDLLTQRLAAVTKWLKEQSETKGLNLGLFGASTGAAAALKLASLIGPKVVKTVVSRGGRPDLVEPNLEEVQVPTLLIVGGADTGVLELNQEAYEKLDGEKKLEIIPGATHLFEESGALEKVADLAAEWFKNYLS